MFICVYVCLERLSSNFIHLFFTFTISSRLSMVGASDLKLEYIVMLRNLRAQIFHGSSRYIPYTYRSRKSGVTVQNGCNVRVQQPPPPHIPFFFVSAKFFSRFWAPECWIGLTILFDESSMHGIPHRILINGEEGKWYEMENACNLLTELLKVTCH